MIGSKDGGSEWTEVQNQPSARALVSLTLSPQFESDQTMFAGYLEDGIGRSTDGGETWESLVDGLGSYQVGAIALSPAFADDHTVFCAAGIGLYKSKLAGEEWQRVAPDIAEIPYNSISVSPSFVEDGTVIACPARGEMVVTEDGGDSWRDLYFPYQNYGIAVASFSPDFSNDRTLVIGVREQRSNGEIGIGVWKSQDFGKSWDTLMSQGGGSYWITVLVPPSYPRDQSVFAGSRNRVFRPLRRSADVSRAGRRQLWMGERVARVRRALSRWWLRQTTITTRHFSPQLAPAYTCRRQVVWAGTI